MELQTKAAGSIVVLLLSMLCTRGNVAAAVETPVRADAPRPARLGRLALPFVENRGQAHPSVAFYRADESGHVAFTRRGVVFGLEGPERARVALEFAGASPDARPTGRAPSGATINSFSGPRDRWRTDLASFDEIIYSDLWPGIDVVFRTGGSHLKYDVVVHPGADPRRVAFVYRTAEAELTESGAIEVATRAGTLREEAPVSYQESRGGRERVASAFRQLDATEGLAFGFEVGAYDTSRTLVIDPEIVYSGLVAGRRSEDVADVTTDAAGNIYLVGSTASAPAQDFPAVAGPDITFNSEPTSPVDAYIAKVSPDGSRLVYCGYIGGLDIDYATGVAVDASGAAYVFGTTYSNPSSELFPVLVGPYLVPNEGGSFNPSVDAFVAKVKPDGSGLVYCGYVGGSQADESSDIAVDAQGAAYLVGASTTNLSLSNVPILPRACQTNGKFDGWLTKVKPDGSGLAFIVPFEGDGQDRALGVAVDANGAAYVTGVTSSANFCRVARGPKTSLGGGVDAFVGKVKADGSGFDYLGFIGGAADDIGVRIAVDASGAAYVAGGTKSRESSFPVVGGPDLTHNGPADTLDGFVAKVKPDGTGLVYCGYVGGAGDDGCSGIAVDSSGRAVVSGFTVSNESSFPLVEAVDGSFNGGTVLGDAFVAQVRANGSGLSFSSYLGGTGEDTGLGVAVDAEGTATVVGLTLSEDGSFPVANAFNSTPRGDADVFVTKLVLGPPGPPAPVVASAVKEGKFLVVTGSNFETGAVILVNGAPVKTKKGTDPSTSLKSKKGGKTIMPGDKVKVRNPDGRESNEVTFGG